MTKILVLVKPGPRKVLVEDIARLFPEHRFEYADTVADAANKLAGAKIVLLGYDFGKAAATGNDFLNSTRGKFSFTVVGLEPGLDTADSRLKYAGYHRDLLVESIRKALLYVA